MVLFLVLMENAIVGLVFKGVEIVKIRGAPIFSNKREL